VIRLGTRPSALALAQAGLVADRLRATGREVEMVEVRTPGDGSSAPIPQLGVGVFVSALRDALAAGTVDLAVHSYKDLPTAPDPRLVLAAVPTREDPRDALVASGDRVLGQLPQGARVGTGSPRRRVQLAALGLGLRVVPIRGNVDTRVTKVACGELDAVVVAAAGLRRLGRIDAATELIDPLQMLPAPAQGALAVECRSGGGPDAALAELLRDTLDDELARATVTAERAVLAALAAGCSAPVGALADIVSDLDDQGRAVDRILLRAVVATPDEQLVRASVTGEIDHADKLGAALAAELLDLAGGRISTVPPSVEHPGSGDIG